MIDDLDPHRGAATLLTVGILAVLVPATVGVAVQWHGTPWWWSLVVLSGVSAALTLTALGASGRTPVTWGARCHVGMVAAALGTLPLVSDLTYTETEPPWVAGLVVSAVGGCVLAFRDWWPAVGAGLAVVGLQISLQLGATWQVSTTHLLSNAVFDVLVLALVAATLHTLVRSRDLQAVEAARAAAGHSRARTAEQVNRHHVQWDALIHDEVLATLETVVRSGPGDDVRAAARAAAERLERGPEPEGADAASLRERLLEVVLTTCPHAETAFRSPERGRAVIVPGPVLQAVVSAATEALRNVAAHAYPSQSPGPVLVELVHSPDGVAVTIRDRGRGFRRERVPPTSFGVTLSIEEHMHAAGGSAEVRSKPGAGTEVFLSWSPEATR